MIKGLADYYRKKVTGVMRLILEACKLSHLISRADCLSIVKGLSIKILQLSLILIAANVYAVDGAYFTLKNQYTNYIGVGLTPIAAGLDSGSGYNYCQSVSKNFSGNAQILDHRPGMVYFFCDEPGYFRHDFYHSYYCDAGKEFHTLPRGCVCPFGEAYNEQLPVPMCQKEKPGKDHGCPGGNAQGNPCNVASGNKFQSETDITGSLKFTRSYNSSNPVDLGLGHGWRNTYQKRVSVFGDELTLVSATGRGEPWTKVGGAWVGDTDSDTILTETAAGFTLTKQNGGVENYNSDGQITLETDAQGKQTSYSYDANDRLAQISNHYGHSLTFTYDISGHLGSVTDASNATYKYEYDASENLSAVVYPDLTPNDDSDNPRRTYIYDQPGLPNHLTGIMDAEGNRFATFAYDANGKAITTRHAQTDGAFGQEQFQFDYQGQ